MCEIRWRGAPPLEAGEFSEALETSDAVNPIVRAEGSYRPDGLVQITFETAFQRGAWVPRTDPEAAERQAARAAASDAVAGEYTVVVRDAAELRAFVQKLYAPTRGQEGQF